MVVTSTSVSVHTFYREASKTQIYQLILYDAERAAIIMLITLIYVELCPGDIFVGALPIPIVVVETAVSPLEFLHVSVVWPPVDLWCRQEQLYWFTISLIIGFVYNENAAAMTAAAAIAAATTVRR